MNPFSSTSPLFQSLVTFELSTPIYVVQKLISIRRNKEKCETQEPYKSFIKKHDERILFVKNIVLMINIMISLQRSNKHISNIDESQGQKQKCYPDQNGTGGRLNLIRQDKQEEDV